MVTWEFGVQLHPSRFFFFFKSSYIPRRSNEVQSGHMLSSYYSSQELVRATGQTTYPSASHTCLSRITTC
jgi:hypothetical protein